LPEIYVLDCATTAPTATELRKALKKIQASAARLVLSRDDPSDELYAIQCADSLLAALDTPDSEARRLAYRALTAQACMPFHQIKRRLQRWRILSPIDRAAIVAAARLPASLDVETLVPASGRFPDPALAHLVAALIPLWKSVTGRKHFPSRQTIAT
jgi:hypothetical protein